MASNMASLEHCVQLLGLRDYYVNYFTPFSFIWSNDDR